MIDKTLLKLFKKPVSYKMESEYQVSPVPVKPVVTIKDSKSGYLTRYFVRPVNDKTTITEIDSKQYNTLKNNPRFICVSLKWKIVGKKESITTYYGARMYGVEELNRKIISDVDLTFGGLINYISDYTEFWVSED